MERENTRGSLINLKERRECYVFIIIDHPLDLFCILCVRSTPILEYKKVLFELNFVRSSKPNHWMSAEACGAVGHNWGLFL